MWATPRHPCMCTSAGMRCSAVPSPCWRARAWRKASRASTTDRWKSRATRTLSPRRAWSTRPQVAPTPASRRSWRCLPANWTTRIGCPGTTTQAWIPSCALPTSRIRLPPCTSTSVETRWSAVPSPLIQARARARASRESTTVRSRSRVTRTSS